MLTEGWTTKISHSYTICNHNMCKVQCVNHNAITMAQTARGQSWPGRTVPTAANLVQTQSLYEDSECLYSDQNLKSQRPLGQNFEVKKISWTPFWTFALTCWFFCNISLAFVGLDDEGFSTISTPCGCHFTVMQAEERLDCRMIAGFQW